jgi:ABC-type sugar transport system substrate-binding protein
MILPSTGRSSAATTAIAVVLVGGLALAGCSKSAKNTGSTGSSATSSAAATGAATTSAAPVTVATQSVQSASGACTYQKYGAPKLTLKGATVGFSQSEATSNPFRATETKSITTQAATAGVKLIQRNANGNVAQQNTDIENMIAQGAKALIVAPENSDGLAAAFAQAKSKHIPILTIDRTVTGTACSDFIGFIGSNFLGQAKIAADDLGTAMGGKGKVAVLEGTSGNNVAQDRTSGFDKELKAKFPNIKIVASQTANFDQATGQKVTEQILQSHPDITGLYAENDGMVLGALQAMKGASKTPGKDIKVVSIDGIRQAVQGVASGQLVSVIETNPRFGPLAFQTLTNFYSGKGVPTTVIIADHHFTHANAAAALKNGDVY